MDNKKFGEALTALQEIGEAPVGQWLEVGKVDVATLTREEMEGFVCFGPEQLWFVAAAAKEHGNAAMLNLVTSVALIRKEQYWEYHKYEPYTRGEDFSPSSAVNRAAKCKDLSENYGHVVDFVSESA